MARHFKRPLLPFCDSRESAGSNRLWPGKRRVVAIRLRHKNATATSAAQGVRRILVASLNTTVYSGTALRACQLLGGPDEVARRAGVSSLLIKAILKDSLVPPPSLFLKIVDILMSAEASEARRQP